MKCIVIIGQFADTHKNINKNSIASYPENFLTLRKSKQHFLSYCYLAYIYARNTEVDQSWPVVKFGQLRHSHEARCKIFYVFLVNVISAVKTEQILQLTLTAFVVMRG
jgi:hypothetical protein